MPVKPPRAVENRHLSPDKKGINNVNNVPACHKSADWLFVEFEDPLQQNRCSCSAIFGEVEKVKIQDPSIYFGKKICVFPTDGQSMVCELYGFDYDFDDDGNEFLEFDVNDEDGIVYSFTEDEIERIEIVG